MAIEIKLKIKGLDKLRANFARAPEFTYTELQKGINQAGLVANYKIREVTPVLTGALKGSIRPSFGKLKVTISPHKFYSIYVHFGTRFMKPRPFMEIGLRNSKTEIENIFNNSVNNILNKIANI